MKMILLVFSLCCSLANAANVTRYNLNCAQSGDASRLVNGGEAQFSASVVGAIAADLTKEKSPKEAGYIKHNAAAHLKYKLRVRVTKSSQGPAVGESEGDLQLKDLNLYQWENNPHKKLIVVSNSEPKSGTIFLNATDKGWTAKLQVWLNSPKSSESLKSVSLSAELPCTVTQQ